MREGNFVGFTLAENSLAIQINAQAVTALVSGNHSTTIYVIGGQKFTVSQDLETVTQLLRSQLEKRSLAEAA